MQRQNKLIKYLFKFFVVFIISDDKAPATFKFHIFMNSHYVRSHKIFFHKSLTANVTLIRKNRHFSFLCVNHCSTFKICWNFINLAATRPIYMDHCVIIFAGFCLLLYIFLTQGTIKRHFKDKTDHLQPWLNSLEVQICQVFKLISKISICLWHRECIKLLKTSYDMNTTNQKQKVLPVPGHSCI